ncbi:MAG: bifunctional methylenetetrahydrofolate dehydrogenase/methenyltetrahydrofolate cyclohydrolase, partial [Candidatus Eremiobacteraeota bacterium]|nr:bifunctional methylenetetrahydrofolate dehydrogenase/methenyltetrahydrofolate cyclohydrolase [Candidatus Eremiobacteraeota bacterium]
MPALILDGRALAADLRLEILARTSALREAGIHSRLVVVFVGQNESSAAYARNLQRTGERVGVTVEVDELSDSAPVGTVRERLDRLRDDASVHGVMLQQPLPPYLSIREI